MEALIGAFGKILLILRFKRRAHARLVSQTLSAMHGFGSGA